MPYFNKKFSTQGMNRQPQNVSYPNSYKNRYDSSSKPTNQSQQITDYGPYPFVVNIEDATKNNTAFRTALWTGPFLQLTLMSILPGQDIGLEVHNDLDQFIRIEEGKGMLMMGDTKDTPNFQQTVFEDYAFIIPAGKWHNLINVGSEPLKLYSIYAPPQHPFGTVHATKAIAEEAEKHD